MQPKSTRQATRNLFSRLTAVLFFIALTPLTQAQQGRTSGQPVPSSKQRTTLESRTEAKLRRIQSPQNLNVNPASTNDAGITVTRAQSASVQRTEAICATFTGSLGTGDATMSPRLFRGGAPANGNCTTPYPFPGTSGTGPYYVDVHTYTNTTGLTQCGTFTLTTTDVTNANIQFAIYNNTFNPASLSTNYLADPDVSTGTPAAPAGISCQLTVNAGQTIQIIVFSANVNSTAAGTASNYTMTVDFPICASAPCSGTPAPGNTISSVSTVCSGINFNLSLQNTTAGSGVSYQWQSAPSASGPWTNITGATNPTLTTSQTAATCYQCIVTCSSPGAGSATSTPVCVALTPPSGCYCTPPASDCTDDDVITRVRISTLDNSSTCGTGPPAGYSNFTSLPAPVVFAGAPNPITVNVPTVWSEYVAVWVDYNQNGNFETTEYTAIGSNAGNGGVITNNINIPANALTGVTRMRVRVRFGTGVIANNLPCSAFTFGETEDYNVNIQPCVPVTVTSSPASATITCGGNATFSVTTAGSLPTYRWEFRPNASTAWQFVPSAAPYSGENTATLTITNASAAYNGYQYRCVIQGGCSATDFSNAATLTVNPLIPTVNPPSATICLGSIQQLTLTNTTGNTDLLSEGFNSVAALAGAGWAAQNLSAPLGPSGWFQGDATVFAAQSGASNSYIAANWQNTTTTGVGTISNWLMTPQLPIKNGDIIRFWSRANDGTSGGGPFPDRLEVRMSTNGASTNVGASSTSTGDFTTLLLTINSSLTTTGYPFVWTQYTATVSGLAGPVSGRFAFRYWVTNAGGAAPNSDYIGIDNVTFTSVGGPAQGIWGGPAGTIFTDASATTAYVAGTPLTTVWVKPTATGVNNYTVFYNTSTPCTSSTTTVPVTVHSPVTGLAVAPATVSVCLGGSTTLNASNTGGTPVNYQWQVSTDGGITYTNINGATSASYTIAGVTATMTGNRYRVVPTGNVCGAVPSAPSVLTVLALPNVTLTSPQLLLVPGRTTSVTASSTPAALNATSWSWWYNGNSITPPNNTNTISGINVDQTGTYQAEVTDVNGCKNRSNIITIGSESSDRLWIYPNPTSGQFQVRLYYNSNVAERRRVHIFNELGQIIMSRDFDLVTETPEYLRMDFDLSKQARGVYVVKVVHEYSGRIVSGLVIKQ